MCLLKVLFTIDTEVHAINKDWRRDNLQRDICRDIEGIVGGRCVGLEYQLELFSKRGIKATFMVEPLFSGAPGVREGVLQSIVHRIRTAGHDVQLHLHCEWIRNYPDRVFGFTYRGYLQRFYSTAEQETLVRFAAGLLKDCGIGAPVAFRAGGFGANQDTMDALVNAGIRYDTSFNIGYTPEKCRLPLPPSYGVPYGIRGIEEYPIGAFKDYPGHYRPLQICACSASEIIHALERGEQCGWRYVVIISHTFEMLSGQWRGEARVRNEVVRRFEKLCSFLAENRDRFQTVGFEDLDVGDSETRCCPPNVRGTIVNTGLRQLSQTMNRIRDALHDAQVRG